MFATEFQSISYLLKLTGTLLMNLTHVLFFVIQSDLCYATKKSRLPVLLKPSRSLGSVSSSASSQKPDMHLLHRMFNLDEGLKGRYMEAQPLKDECPSNGTEKGTSEQEGILAGGKQAGTIVTVRPTYLWGIGSKPHPHGC